MCFFVCATSELIRVEYQTSTERSMSREIVFPKSLAEEFREVAAEQRGQDHRAVVQNERPTTEFDGSATPAPDDYSSRLVKYIPAEVITLYVTLNTIILGTGDDHQLLLWSVALFGMIATPIYLYRIGGVRDLRQLGVSTGAYVVWVFALGGPFTTTNWYDPLYGAILLPTYTFVIPLIQFRRSGV
jgi:hypothetical protein